MGPKDGADIAADLRQPRVSGDGPFDAKGVAIAAAAAPRERGWARSG